MHYAQNSPGFFILTLTFIPFNARSNNLKYTKGGLRMPPFAK